MKSVAIQIPEQIMNEIKIPRQQWASVIKKELAFHLYREGYVSFANAHRLAEISKIEFHYLLGERRIPRQYNIENYEKDLENLAGWRNSE